MDDDRERQLRRERNADKLNAARRMNTKYGEAVLDSPDAYWKLVNDGWDDLLNIIAHHLDLEYPAYESPGDPTSLMTGRNVLQEILHLHKTRDPKIARYFNAAWCLASDAYAWSVPFWGAFCDLCSEEWVLHGDAPDEAPDVANLTGQTL